MKVKILGTGCYLPPKILQSSTMEKQLRESLRVTWDKTAARAVAGGASAQWLRTMLCIACTRRGSIATKRDADLLVC